MTRIHLHQLVHVNPDALERPTRLADGPLSAVGPDLRLQWLDAVVVGLTTETVRLNSPDFVLESPVELPRDAVGDDGDVRPQFAADGTPHWAY